MQLGSVSTLGFIIARYLYEEGLKAVNRAEMLVEDMEIEGSADTAIRCMNLLSQSVERIGLTLRWECSFSLTMVMLRYDEKERYSVK